MGKSFTFIKKKIFTLNLVKIMFFLSTWCEFEEIPIDNTIRYFKIFTKTYSAAVKMEFGLIILCEQCNFPTIASSFCTVFFDENYFKHASMTFDILIISLANLLYKGKYFCKPLFG
jgi:hypothetical protein